MRQFGTETVHNANGMFAICPYQWMGQVKSHQKLLNADAAIDQVDLERPLAQHLVAVFQLIWRDDLHVVAFLAEEIAEQLELAQSRLICWPKLQNGDIRFLVSAELLVGLQQRSQQVLLAAHAA